MGSIQLYSCFEHWLHGGQIFFYSDPHFNDTEMVHLRKNYIGDIEQINSINSVIGKKDTLIILGDVGDTTYVKRIRGYKVLITGNHDVGTSKYLRQVRTECIYCSDYRNNWDSAQAALLEAGDPDFIGLEKTTTQYQQADVWIAHYDNHLFDEVYEGPLTISPKILLSHEPIDYPYALNIHGHDHANWFVSPTHLNMCAEHINYRPVPLKPIVTSGILKSIQDIHRVTIDRATQKSQSKIGS